MRPTLDADAVRSGLRKGNCAGQRTACGDHAAVEVAQDGVIGTDIGRTKGSSTQRVVDRAFRTAGFEPAPLLTLDTRDAVYEAVVNGLGDQSSLLFDAFFSTVEAFRKDADIILDP